MGIFRLYTRDGVSAIEELDVAKNPELTRLFSTKGATFRSVDPGYFSDWHTAPRRQMVITLSGEAEIGLKDGTIHRLRAGDVNIAEDVTGSGHTTRAVGSEPRVTLTVHLGDD
jgi:quercetin dioxygenase-like cupin family protein